MLAVLVIASPAAWAQDSAAGDGGSLSPEEEYETDRTAHPLYSEAQDEFTSLVAEAQQYAEFAYADFDRQTAHGVIGFVGESPLREDRVRLKSASVTVERADHTSEEIAESARAIDLTLLREGATATMVVPDVRGSKFIAYHNASATAEQASQRENPGKNVEFRRSNNAAIELHAQVAGGLLRDGSSKACTSGNTVVNAYGTRHILTAGHCRDDWPGIDNIINHDGNQASLTNYAKSIGQWGDWARYGGIGTFSDNYYTGPGSGSTDPDHVGGISTGTDVCMYGDATDAERCGVIDAVNISVGGMSRLARVSACLSQDGDSGGLYYLPNTDVVGIVTGCYRHTIFQNDSIFSQLRYADDAFSAWDVYFDP